MLLTIVWLGFDEISSIGLNHTEQSGPGSAWLGMSRDGVGSNRIVSTADVTGWGGMRVRRGGARRGGVGWGGVGSPSDRTTFIDSSAPVTQRLKTMAVGRSSNGPFSEESFSFMCLKIVTRSRRRSPSYRYESTVSPISTSG